MINIFIKNDMLSNVFSQNLNSLGAPFHDLISHCATLDHFFLLLEQFYGYVENSTEPRELHQIIQTKSYDFAAKIMKKYGDRILKVEKAEKLVTYLYDKLLEKSTVIKGSDFTKDCKVVFCPICCPDPEVATKFSLIEKAIIIKNRAQIYICKPCKLVWFDPDDIRTDNAQSYKRFMKTLGLKGLWKELSNVDTL